VKVEPPFESATSSHLPAPPSALQQPDAAPLSAPSAFLTLRQLCERLPLSERTIRGLIKKGHLPVIILPHSRRLLFDFESVRNSLLRRQRGGGAA